MAANGELLEIPKNRSFRLFSSLVTTQKTPELKDLIDATNAHFGSYTRCRGDWRDRFPSVVFHFPLDKRIDSVIAYIRGTPVGLQLFSFEEDKEAIARGLYVPEHLRRQKIGSMLREVTFHYLRSQDVFVFDNGGGGYIYKDKNAQGFARHDMAHYGEAIDAERTPVRGWIRREKFDLKKQKQRYDVSGIEL